MCMPDGTGEVNREGVKYYNTLIDALLAHGMNSFYILHHGPICLYHRNVHIRSNKCNCLQ